MEDERRRFRSASSHTAQPKEGQRDDDLNSHDLNTTRVMVRVSRYNPSP
jgi:hypothetical protein